jgi:hemolysin III
LDIRGIDVHGLAKPLLRGRIHVAALVAAVPAGVLLVAGARAGAPRVAAAVYAASLVILYAASSAYHRLARTHRSQRLLRRLDHSSIYLLIAGSYTPVVAVVLEGWWRVALLVAVWTAAIVGVVLKLAWFESVPIVGAGLYIVMGWAAVAVAPSIAAAVPASTMALIVAGGLLYTLGAIVLLTKVPNPSPRVYGYHEVWHTMVVVAGVLHYAAIRQIVAA